MIKAAHNVLFGYIVGCNSLCLPQCGEHAGADSGGFGTAAGNLVGVDRGGCAGVGMAKLGSSRDQIHTVCDQHGYKTKQQTFITTRQLQPIPLQNLTLQIKRILLRSLDRMELAGAGQVFNILPGAAEDFGGFLDIDHPLNIKAPKVGFGQGHHITHFIQHRIRDAHVHIPLHGVSTGLEACGKEVFRIAKQGGQLRLFVI